MAHSATTCHSATSRSLFCHRERRARPLSSLVHGWLCCAPLILPGNGHHGCGWSWPHSRGNAARGASSPALRCRRSACSSQHMLTALAPPPLHRRAWRPKCPAADLSSETMLKARPCEASLWSARLRSRCPHSQANGGVAIPRVGAHTARRHKVQGVAHSTGCCAPNMLGCA